MIFKEFKEQYNELVYLFEKLEIIYDSIDEIFLDKKLSLEDKLYSLKEYIEFFNDIEKHSSELKTLLVLSKPYREHSIIKDSRESLYNTYKNKHENNIP